MLPHYPRQTKHFSAFRMVRPWNVYVTAELFRIDACQRDSAFLNLEMEHGNLLVAKRGAMNCFPDFFDHGCKTSI